MILKHAPFYSNYVNSVSLPVGQALKLQLEDIHGFLVQLNEEKLNFKYAEDKWTIKEVLLHCLDVERIMTARALMLCRGEQVDLPGFDENAYAANMYPETISLEQLLSDFRLLRESNSSLYGLMPEVTNDLVGTMAGQPISVGSLWHIIVGHWSHHLSIIKERYLKQTSFN